MFQHTSLNHKVQVALFKRRLTTLIGIAFAILIALLVLFRASVVSSVRRVGAEGVWTMSTADRRLSARLGLKTGVDLTVAFDERRELLRKKLHLRFVDETGVVRAERDLLLAEQPSLIVFQSSADGVMHAVVSEERVQSFLTELKDIGVSDSSSCTVLSTYQDTKSVLRAQTTCVAKVGRTLDISVSASAIMSALVDETPSIDLTLRTVEPTVVDPALSDAGSMTLLATGHSTFKGSGAGRKANVRKAVNERLNNIIVPAGETFSFNSVLGGEISVRRGWHMALTIFDGGTLRPAPGGGICQASTTLFRAALRAGLPIVAQKNHSLYVTYYEAHGVGLDATVFPGQQDLKFLNDTGHRILVQSYTDGDEAYVQIFGTPDERRVTLSGPFFASTTPEDFRASGRTIKTNEVVWRRTVETVAGVSESVITSRYKAIPKSLPKKYTSKTEVTMGTDLPVHAVAEAAVAVQW